MKWWSISRKGSLVKWLERSVWAVVTRVHRQCLLSSIQWSGYVPYRWVDSLASSKVTRTLKNTLKYWGSIRSHRLANYSVPITGSWKQIMHQDTSPPSLDLAHGRGSTKCQIYRGQHSHQDLSPTDNALVSAKEQSEFFFIFFFIDLALKRTQNTSCRCVERNAIAIHKRTAWFSSTLVFAWFSFRSDILHDMIN